MTWALRGKECFLQADESMSGLGSLSFSPLSAECGANSIGLVGWIRDYGETPKDVVNMNNGKVVYLSNMIVEWDRLLLILFGTLYLPLRSPLAFRFCHESAGQSLIIQTCKDRRSSTLISPDIFLRRPTEWESEETALFYSRCAQGRSLRQSHCCIASMCKNQWLPLGSSFMEGNDGERF